MTIIYRADKGAPLTAAEVDGNFHDLDDRLTELTETGILPDNISTITVIGSQMTIFLESGTSFGPFTLPIAMIHWAGEYETDGTYNELDLVLVPDDGVYLVRVDHTADGPFDDSLVIDETLVYHKLFGIGEGGGGGGGGGGTGEVVADSNGRTVTAEETGTTFTNQGASALAVFDLPGAAAGLDFTFVVQDADGIEVNAASGDTIRLTSNVSGTGGKAESTTIGSVLHLKAINSTEWVAISALGTWVVT